MPDRGKERDGTDGIMLPSNLLLCQEQTAVAHGQQWHTDTLGYGHTGTQPHLLPNSQGSLPQLLPWPLGSLAGGCQAEASRS